jgi:AraC-like DNA-binding protein/mannose-6-phosphate isomerase-like protein (cupin superfamily)
VVDDMDVLKIKRGYLKGDFEYFHLKDKKNMEFEFHYHDFDKIIIFISGKVTYLIEGKAYKLKPRDILFINSNDVHKPVISPEEPYERIIIWVNSKFLDVHNRDGNDLSTCFKLSSKRRSNLLRINSLEQRQIEGILINLEDASKGIEFGSGILKNSLFLQLVVYLNRLFIRTEITIKNNDIEYDKRIEGILNYINDNLGNDLSIENISAQFYVNKYYLMHSFKEQTGYTIHNYIQQKRLIKAASLIKKGLQTMDVCSQCGFGDYSSFVRAFKKIFNLSPKNYFKTISELDGIYLNNISGKEH